MCFIVGLASAQDATSVRNQFTDEQWKTVQSFRGGSLILPTFVPSGYRVGTVFIQRRPDAGERDLLIEYKGNCRASLKPWQMCDEIEWHVEKFDKDPFGSTGGGGGDPDPADVGPPITDVAKYSSRLLGDGTVTTGGPDATCLSTRAWYPAMSSRPTGVMAKSCNVAARDLAHMMESATLRRQ
jgi:hypothetical protein